MKIDRGELVLNWEEYKAIRTLLDKQGVNTRITKNCGDEYWVQFMNPFKDECFMIGAKAVKSAEAMFDANYKV